MNVFNKASAVPTLSTPATPKGEQTRARILETALRLFRERGYEKTTMRLVAQEAGISLGNAYYYFESKELLIQAFYAWTHQEHLEACRGLLEREREFQKRLVGVIRAKINTSMPYHRFSRLLFKAAADPHSPLNPFSRQSGLVRRQAVDLFVEVVEGSTKPPADPLRERLPQLLWLYEMGIVLFWIHDDSPGCDRTYRLIERTCELIGRLVSLARFPLIRPLVRTSLELLAEIGFPEVSPEAPRSGEDLEETGLVDPE